MIAVCANPKCGKIIRRPPSRILAKAYCGIECRLEVERRECPFSADQLHELHWTLEKGLKEIALLASQEMNWEPPITAKVVRRWMTVAGVSIRTRKEYGQLLVSKGTAEEHTRKAREVQAEMRSHGFVATDGHHMHTPEVRAKLAKITKEIGAAKHETRQCENPACGNDVTRIPSEFREHVYCSVSCASKVNYAKRPLQPRKSSKG